MLQYPHLPPTASCTHKWLWFQQLPPSSVRQRPCQIPSCLEPPQVHSLKGRHVPTQGIHSLSLQGPLCWSTALTPVSNNPSPQHPSSSPEGSGSSWPCPRPGRVPPCPGPCVLPSSLPYCPLPHSSAICLSVHLSTHPSLHQPVTLWAYPCARCCSWESPVPGEGPHRLKPLLQVHSSSCPLQLGLLWPPALGQSPHLCYPQCRLFTLCCNPHSPCLCQLLGWGQVQD